MSVLSGILGAASTVADIGVSAWNTAQQTKNNAWQKKSQEITWQREDNAVQRRVADLKAAGLSPTLAAGSAASTSAPIQRTAPQMESGQIAKGVETTNNALQLMQQKANIAQTAAQTQLIQLQQNKELASTKNLEIENAYRSSADPGRLEALSLDNRKRGLDNVSREINNQIDTLGITQAQVDIAKSRLMAESLQLGLTEKDIDIMAKQLAVEQAQVNLNQSSHNYDLYKTLGLPSNQSWDPFTKGGAIVGNAVTNLLDKLGEKNALQQKTRKEILQKAGVRLNKEKR